MQKFKIGDKVKRWHQGEYMLGTIRDIKEVITKPMRVSKRKKELKTFAVYYIDIDQLARGSVTATDFELQLNE